MLVICRGKEYICLSFFKTFVYPYAKQIFTEKRYKLSACGNSSCCNSTTDAEPSRYKPAE